VLFAVQLTVSSIFSLQDVLMQDARLYLIFEFLSMDLKKYLDTIPSGQYLDRSRVKVMRIISLCNLKIIGALQSYKQVLTLALILTLSISLRKKEGLKRQL